MKSKTFIVLIVAFVACVAYVTVRHTGFIEWLTSRPGGEQGWEDKKVFAKEPQGAKELVITPAGGESIVLKKSAQDKWRLAEPDAQASRTRIEDVVETITELKARRSFEPGSEGAPGAEVTGLDRPRWTIELTDEKDKKFTLRIGAQVPLSAGGRTYVRPDEADKTCVVDVDFDELLKDSPWGYIDKKVLSLKTDQITRVRVDGAESYELKKVEGQWGIVAPVDAAAAEDKVSDLLDELTDITAEDFVKEAEPDPALYGLTEDAARKIVTIHTEPPAPTTQPETAPATRKAEGRTYVLLLGNKRDEQVYARLKGRPLIFTVEADLAENITPALADLRQRTVLEIETDAIVKVDITTSAGRTVIHKKDDQWKMARPYAGRASDTQVKQLLDDIAALKAEDFPRQQLPLGAYGLDEPRGKIILHRQGESRTRTLLIGQKSASGKMAFVKTATDTSVAVVPAEKVEPLLAGPANYWHAKLLNVPQELNATRLKLNRPDGRFVVEKSDGAWKLATPVAADAEAENVKKIVDKLGDLKADEITALGETVPEKYAKLKDKITVSLVGHMPSPATATAPAATRPARSGTKTYKFIAAASETHTYVWVPDAAPVAVGEFPRDLFETLSAELRNRTVWKINPDDIHTISIRAGEKPLILKRKDDGWSYTEDPYVKIEADKVEDYLKDVKEITAEQFETYKTPKNTARFALNDPWIVLELEGEDGKPMQMRVSHKGADKNKNRFAVSNNLEGVFVISAGTAEKLAKSLDDFTE